MDLSFIQFFYRDFILTVKNYQKVFPFIQENKLWKGALRYSWLSKFLFLVGLLLSLHFGKFLLDWWNSEPLATGLSMGKIANLTKDTFQEAHQLVISGGYKYVILILLEVIIYHFSRKTYEVLSGEPSKATLNDFLRAQIRMIKVIVFSFIMEMVFVIIAQLILSILGLDMIELIVVFLIQCFFLGFAIVDNYNEIHGMSINQSFKYTRQYLGVAVAVGMILYVLMMIPLFGTVFAPILVAVGATLTMYELNKQDDSLEEYLV